MKSCGATTGKSLRKRVGTRTKSSSTFSLFPHLFSHSLLPVHAICSNSWSAHHVSVKVCVFQNETRLCRGVSSLENHYSPFDGNGTSALNQQCVFRHSCSMNVCIPVRKFAFFGLRVVLNIHSAFKTIGNIFPLFNEFNTYKQCVIPFRGSYVRPRVILCFVLPLLVLIVQR